MNPSDLDAIRREFYDGLRPQSPLEWMERNTQIVDAGTGEMASVTFDDRPFFREIAEDCFMPGMETILMKGRQIGASELVLRGMHKVAIDRPNTSVVHTMNDFVAMNSFINQKLPALYNSPGIAAHLMAHSMDQKKRADAVLNRASRGFKNGSIYSLLMLKKEAQAKAQAYRGVRIDALALDEFADVEESQLIPIIKCTSASGLKILFYLGTPKLQYSRFHDMFTLHSDLRRWWVMCGCGTEQPLMMYDDWTTFQSLIKQRPEKTGYYFACRGCGAELDRRHGRWIPDRPGARVRGYHIPQLVCPWISADMLMLEFQLATGHQRTMFIRETLGIPYSGQDAPVREEWLEGCIDTDWGRYDTVPDAVPCYGHDWGNISHYGVIYPSNGALYISDVNDMSMDNRNDHTEQIRGMFTECGQFVACLDHGDGKAPNQVLMPLFPGKVWSVVSGDPIAPISWDTARGDASRKINWHVTINHTVFVEDVASLFERRIFRFPGRTEQDRAWSRSLFPMIMRVERVLTDKPTGTVMSYSTTRAHTFCALMYAYVASMRAGGARSSRSDAVSTLPSDDAPTSPRGRGMRQRADEDVWHDESSADELWR